jgi:WD40 repeat protein
MIIELGINDSEDLLSIACSNGIGVYGIREEGGAALEEKAWRTFKDSCITEEGCFVAEDECGFGIASLLGRSNFVALVGVRAANTCKYSNNRLVVWDDSQSIPIIELEFKSPVKAVRMTKGCILVAIQSKFYIYSFSNEPELLKVSDCTCRNNQSLAVCCAGTTKMAAFSGSSPGDVELLNLDKVQEEQKNVIHAHHSEIVCLAFNQTGTFLATASEKGTIVRVFDLASLASEGSPKLAWEFRRGTDRANIYSLAFSPDGAYLAASSDTGTVHIFKLDSEQERNPLKESLIHTYVPKYLIPKRSWAQASVTSGEKNLLVFVKGCNLMVVGQSGNVHKFAINHRKGGECIEVERFVFFQNKGD